MLQLLTTIVCLFLVLQVEAYDHECDVQSSIEEAREFKKQKLDDVKEFFNSIILQTTDSESCSDEFKGLKETEGLREEMGQIFDKIKGQCEAFFNCLSEACTGEQEVEQTCGFKALYALTEASKGDDAAKTQLGMPMRRKRDVLANKAFKRFNDIKEETNEEAEKCFKYKCKRGVAICMENIHGERGKGKNSPFVNMRDIAHFFETHFLQSGDTCECLKAKAHAKGIKDFEINCEKCPTKMPEEPDMCDTRADI